MEDRQVQHKTLTLFSYHMTITFTAPPLSLDEDFYSQFLLKVLKRFSLTVLPKGTKGKGSLQEKDPKS